MAERHEGGRAYLLIAFDLPNQKILSTSEVVGPFEAEVNEVQVDWKRVFQMVEEQGLSTPPKGPPWGRPVDDDDDPPKGPPWGRPKLDDDDLSAAGSSG